MSYLIVAPCRNEADFLRESLESVVHQTVQPTKLVIVDDGSTDDTSKILAEYGDKYDWISIVTREDRGSRSVGPGVVDAFYVGLDQVDISEYEFLCKLDMDLILPEDYFQNLIEQMRSNRRLGCCSGKPYFNRGEKLISEKIGDDMCVGMTKFYRSTCFEEIGGFVREVSWDGIDCHRCRLLGWIACSWDDPKLRFIHLRPMGSSQTSIWAGRNRAGFGQYFMGVSPVYFLATVLYRATRPPYLVGGLGLAYGYFRALFKGEPRYSDKELVSFIRRYHRRVLFVGKRRAMDELDLAQALRWHENH